MKKIKLILLFIALTLFVSCDDYLRVDSPSSDDTAYIFGSIEEAQSFIDGVYQPFMEEYTNAMSLYANPSSDVEMVKAGSSPDNGRRDGATCETNPSNSAVVSSSYNNAYVAINRANIAIDGIKQSEMYASKNENMMQLLGEAITLRAFWYSELVKHFGDVPFKITPTKAGDDFYLPRTDRDSILSFVIDDMINIEPYMKYAQSTSHGVEQIGREFTQSLIARVALARGGYSLRKGLIMERRDDYMKYYQIANDYCKKVIESGTHSLTSSYTTVFMNQNKFVVPSGDDIIYEIAYGPGRGEIGYVPGKRIDSGTHPYGGGGGYYNYTPSYIYSFDTLDLRIFTKKEEASTATYTYIGADLKELILNVQDVQVNKWCKYWMNTPMGEASSKGTSINWPIMRYADVLLMYAETENELNNGPTEAAREALRKVRRRAFASQYWGEKVDTYVSSASSNKDSFFSAIVNERAWELGGELLRPFDLVRWNMFGPKIMEARETMIQMGKDVSSGTGKYGQLPDKIYWKLNTTTGKIDIQGLFRKLPSAPAGYTAKDWLNTLYKNNTPASFLDYNWRGITSDPSKVANYLLPIPANEISKSNGKLSNAEYGWND